MKYFLILLTVGLVFACGFFTAHWIYDRPVPLQVTPPDTSYSVIAIVDTTHKDTTVYVKHTVDTTITNIVYKDTTILVPIEIPAGSKYAEDEIEVKSPAKVKTRFYFDKNLFSHSLEYFPITAPAPVDKTCRWTFGLMVNGGYPQSAGAGLYYHRIDKGIFIGVDGGYKHYGITAGVDFTRGKMK